MKTIPRRSLFAGGVIAIPAIWLLTAWGCTRPPSVDLEAERAALLAADQAWSDRAVAFSTSQTPEAFEALISPWADDAVFLGDGMPRVSGKPAIRKVWGDMGRLPGFSIRWKPDGATVAASGELGYTFGSNEFTFNDAKGDLVTTRGKYLTIWRKQPDGSWKGVMDMGNSDGPPVSASKEQPKG
jgi:ketosteroid isomerase-like protein